MRGAAITRQRRRIAAGDAPSRGIGGFHLCCDACARQSGGYFVKQAPPLWALRGDGADLAVAAREAAVSGEAIFDGPQMILPYRGDMAGAQAGVAPGPNRVGIMLPPHAASPAALLLSRRRFWWRRMHW